VSGPQGNYYIQLYTLSTDSSDISGLGRRCSLALLGRMLWGTVGVHAIRRGRAACGRTCLDACSRVRSIACNEARSTAVGGMRSGACDRPWSGTCSRVHAVRRGRPWSGTRGTYGRARSGTCEMHVVGCMRGARGPGTVIMRLHIGVVAGTCGRTRVHEVACGCGRCGSLAHVVGRMRSGCMRSACGQGECSQGVVRVR